MGDRDGTESVIRMERSTQADGLATESSTIENGAAIWAVAGGCRAVVEARSKAYPLTRCSRIQSGRFGLRKEALCQAEET